MARDGVRSGHTEGKQEHHRQHVHRTGRRGCTLGLLRREGGAGGGGNSIGDGHGALSLLLVLVVVVVVASLVVCGGGGGSSNVGDGRGALSLLLVLFDVVVVALLAVFGGVVALGGAVLACAGIVVGLVALGDTLVCKLTVTGILVGLSTLDAGKVLLVLLLDRLQGILLEALRYILLDLLLLRLAPGLELMLGLAIHGALRRRRLHLLGLTSDAREVLAVLVIDWCLSEVLVGLGRVFVDALDLLLVPCLQLLSGVAIRSGCSH
mmetsp:Transcript_162506/g.516246  ORF Transcript_162506/g.516246 Transcript_162506/m.516246 type:complete len:265 (-) Transcript_162506:116-910(-)